MNPKGKHIRDSDPAFVVGNAQSPGEAIDIIIDNNRPSSVRPFRRYEFEVLMSLRKIVRAIDVYSRRLRFQFDITTPQLITLRTLADDGPMSGTLLAQRTCMSPATLSGVVHRLELKELVERTRDKRDRRFVRVNITRKGRRMVTHAPSPLQDSLTEEFKALPKDEQIMISSSLRRVADLIGPTEADAAPILDTGELSR
jgi:DNA-binding MarR family transcriptional regulator